MNGQTLHFGACGAVSNVKNPISLAKHLCNKQCENLSLGRIPPCILVGSGAKTWAERLGLQIVPDSKMVSGKAFKSYKNHRRKLRRFSELNDVKFSPLDTVGAICVDINGIIVAGASSGGIALKHEGRVGQAASFASGVWAEMGSLDKSSIASCTSGCGEHLIRTQLARSVAESLRGQCPPISFANCLRDNFYESPFLWDIPEKLGGALSIYYKESECSGELLWGHTTSSMCIGYMSTVDSKPKVLFSFTVR